MTGGTAFQNATFGTINAGATLISGPIDPGNAWNIVFVTLSTDYAQANPGGALSGFPSRPPVGVPWSPKTITNGTRAQFWQCEAAALVGAGAGVLS